VALARDKVPRLAILEDDVDDAANRPVDSHLQAGDPASVEDGEERFDHHRLQVVADPRPRRLEQPDREVIAEAGRHRDESVLADAAGPTEEAGQLARIHADGRAERTEADALRVQDPTHLLGQCLAEVGLAHFDASFEVRLAHGCGSPAGGGCGRQVHDTALISGLHGRDERIRGLLVHEETNEGDSVEADTTESPARGPHRRIRGLKVRGRRERGGAPGAWRGVGGVFRAGPNGPLATGGPVE
jgi:hypothetical protein